MQTRDEYLAVIKTAFVTLFKRTAVEQITAAVPFLGLPVFNYVLVQIVSMIAVAGFSTAEMLGFFLYIDMRVGKQSDLWEKAAYENFKAQTSGTPQEKRAAELRLKNAHRAFVSLSS